MVELNSYFKGFLIIYRMHDSHFTDCYNLQYMGLYTHNDRRDTASVNKHYFINGWPSTRYADKYHLPHYHFISCIDHFPAHTLTDSSRDVFHMHSITVLNADNFSLLSRLMQI